MQRYPFYFNHPDWQTTNVGGNLTASTGIVNTVSMKQFKEMIAAQKNFQIIALILVELVWMVPLRRPYCPGERMHVSRLVLIQHDTPPLSASRHTRNLCPQWALLRALILPIFYMTDNTIIVAGGWSQIFPAKIYLLSTDSPILSSNFINWKTSLSQMGFDIYQQYYQLFGRFVSFNLKLSIFKSIEKLNLSKCWHKKVLKVLIMRIW